MRAKKIATERSINESDVTLPQHKPSTAHNPIPLTRILKIMAGCIIVAAVAFAAISTAAVSII